jgi:hypothetical protein
MYPLRAGPTDKKIHLPKGSKEKDPFRKAYGRLWEIRK